MLGVVFETEKYSSKKHQKKDYFSFNQPKSGWHSYISPEYNFLIFICDDLGTFNVAIPSGLNASNNHDIPTQTADSTSATVWAEGVWIMGKLSTCL